MTAMTEGYLQLFYRELPLGRSEPWIEWQGSDPAIMPSRVLDAFRVQPKGKVLTVGPYRLRILANRPEWGGHLVMRDGHKAKIIEWLYRITRWQRWLSIRLILTLYVWGLAQWHEGMAVHWGQVNAVAAIQGWLRQRRGKP